MPKNTEEEIAMMSNEFEAMTEGDGLLTNDIEVKKFIVFAGKLWKQVQATINPTVDAEIFATAYNAASTLRDIRNQVAVSTAYSPAVTATTHLDGAMTYLTAVRVIEKAFIAQTQSVLTGICTGYESFIYGQTGLKTKAYLDTDVNKLDASEWATTGYNNFRAFWRYAMKEEFRVPIATVTRGALVWGAITPTTTLITLPCNLQVRVKTYGGTGIAVTGYQVTGGSAAVVSANNTLTGTSSTFDLGTGTGVSLAAIALTGGQENDVIEIWSN